MKARGRGLAVALALALAYGSAQEAAAHSVGLSQGVYRPTAAGAQVTLTLARGEARRFAPELERSGDGELSEVELVQGEAALEAAIVGGLAITRGGAPCAGALRRATLVEEDGLELALDYACPAAGDALTVDFVALRRLGRPHRHVARWVDPESEVVKGEEVLSRMRPPVTLSLRPREGAGAERAGASAAAVAGAAAGADAAAATPDAAGSAPATSEAAGGDAIAYFTLGVEHILGGLDHLVFVLGLLLGHVLGRGGLRRLVVVVTAFTLGHSLSLALALLGGWAPSPAWIEPLIAASIIVVGIENLSVGTSATKAARAAARRPWITGPFGLVHGFGFAGALAAVGLPPAERGPSLLAFNLGVEAGQLLVIALALPLLVAVDRRLGGRRWRRWVDLAVVAAGALWLLERLTAAV